MSSSRTTLKINKTRLIGCFEQSRGKITAGYLCDDKVVSAPFNVQGLRAATVVQASASLFNEMFRTSWQMVEKQETARRALTLLSPMPIS